MAPATASAAPARPAARTDRLFEPSIEPRRSSEIDFETHFQYQPGAAESNARASRELRARAPSPPHLRQAQGEIAIEGSKGKMPRLPGDLRNRAIRKAKRSPAPTVRKRRRNHLRILERGGGDAPRHAAHGNYRTRLTWGLKLLSCRAHLRTQAIMNDGLNPRTALEPDGPRYGRVAARRSWRRGVVA